MEALGFTIVEPISISRNNQYEEVYKDAIIFTVHGSTLLNPLIFSNANIVCLFPSELFFGSPNPRDVEQYSTICAMFGSRVFPVFSIMNDISTKEMKTNESINVKSKYSIQNIINVVNELLHKKVV